MKKFFLTVILTFIAIILFSLSIYATDETGEDTTKWTDFSNVKVEVTQVDKNVEWEYNLKVTGVTFNKESEYKVFITSGENEPKVNDNAENSIDTKENIGNVILANSSLNKAYELNKDVYCYIVEKQGLTYGKIYKTKLPRLNQHKLGSRICASFTSLNTWLTFNEANYTENAKNIKYKIGKVTDKNILLSIKNGEANCLQKLLDYAKTANSIYTGTIEIGVKDSITSNLNLVNNEYYYIYVSRDDENGKYYPVEDVSLYQALVGDTIGKNLYDYLSDEFKWNIENQTPTTPGTTTNTPNTPSSSNNKKGADATTAGGKIPQTGIGMGLISLIIISVGGLIFAYYKCNRLKGI